MYQKTRVVSGLGAKKAEKFEKMTVLDRVPSMEHYWRDTLVRIAARSPEENQKVTPAEFLTSIRPTASTVCQATRSGIHARWVVEPGPVRRFRGQSDHVCAVAMHTTYTIASSAAPPKFAEIAFIKSKCKSGLIPSDSRSFLNLLSSDAVHWHLITLPNVRIRFHPFNNDCVTDRAQ